MVWSNQAPTQIIFPPGATAGARLVIDATGIHAYDSNDNLSFEVDVSSPSTLVLANDFDVHDSIYFHNQPDNVIAASITGNSQVAGTYQLVLDPIGLPGNPGKIILGTPLQIAGGPTGLYNYEEYNLVNQVLTNNTVTNIVGMTPNANYHSAYPNHLNPATGVWTCPESSQYTFFIGVFCTPWVNPSRIFLAVVLNGNRIIVHDLPGVNGGEYSIAGQKWINQGDTVTFQVLQQTGANSTLALDARSYLSIKREL